MGKNEESPMMEQSNILQEIQMYNEKGSKVRDLDIEHKIIKAHDEKMYMIIFNKDSDDLIIEYNDKQTIKRKLELNAVLYKGEAEDYKDINITCKGQTVVVKQDMSDNSKKCVLANIEDIKINGNDVKNIREAARELARRATRTSKDGKKYLDFDEAKYPRLAQDYLLEYLYGKKFKLSPESSKVIDLYKGFEYTLMNQFLRGKYTSRINKTKDIIEKIIELSKIAEAMPRRKFNIMLGRYGQGVGKSKEIGTKNPYYSFVSFSTDDGSTANPSSVQYKKMLEPHELAIPMDLLNLHNYKKGKFRYSEAEMLLLPFEYTVKGFYKNGKRIGSTSYDVIEMGETKRIDIYKLLNRRITEMKKEYIERGEDVEGIDELYTIVEQGKKKKIKIEISDLVYGDEISKGDFEQQYTNNETINKALVSLDINELLKSDKQIIDDTMQYDSETHGKSHTRRVNFFACVLMNKKGISGKDRELILAAVRNHDIGRENDLEDKGHGLKSWEKAQSLGRFSKFSSSEQKIIKFMIERTFSK